MDIFVSFIYNYLHNTLKFSCCPSKLKIFTLALHRESLLTLLYMEIFPLCIFVFLHILAELMLLSKDSFEEL